MTPIRVSVVIIAAAALFAAPAVAATPCERAIDAAAPYLSVPTHILHAVAKVESGVKGRPWPWTLNIAGEPRYFRTRADAERDLLAAVGAGQFVAIGCMQTVWRYHAGRYDHPAQALDPVHNILAAADFLAELRKELGSWTRAVRAYHTRADPARAQAYACAVAQRINPTVTLTNCP